MNTGNFRNAYPELSEKVVLSVDDNEMNQLVIRKIMENVGIKTVAVPNGADAIKVLTDGFRPDFILMDLEMPVMNGLQCCEAIKNKINTQIPIIINSAAVSDHQKWNLRRIGINDFLEKPYSMHDIFDKLSKNVPLVHT
jgi:sigma-B regulation protein RsbU (phosphoserine phosphatase)